MGEGYGYGWGWRGGRGFRGGESGWTPNFPSVPPPPPGALRVAVAAESGDGLNAPVSMRFGRAPYFVIVDVVGGSVASVHVVSNPAVSAPHGAGRMVMNWLASVGVGAVVAGRFGPNVAMAAQALGIKTLTVAPGVRVIDALRSLGIVR